MKVCTKCKQNKKVSEFYKSKKNSSTGFSSECKQCNYEYKKHRRRTKKGLIHKIYSGQCETSVKRNHRTPEYTEKELYEWLMSNEEFHILFNEWKMSNYDKNLIPSIDRINIKIHYCFNNIRLCTWKENLNNEFNRKKKVICQYSNDKDILIGTYIGAKEAERCTGIDRGTITSAARNNRVSFGYYWTYEGDK